MAIKRIGVLTGGGDCPGLNAVIRAVVKKAIVDHGLDVLGIVDGYQGLIDGRGRRLTMDSVKNILPVGGTILGTSNTANPFEYARRFRGKIIKEDVSAVVIKNIKRWQLGALIVIGGDGTLGIARRLMDKGVPVVGIPKTIDNDLCATDITFGHDTAVQVISDAIDRLHTTAQSHHRVMVVEVMGRYVGWLALRGGIAGGGDVILIPEIPFRLDAVMDEISDRRRRGRRFSIVVVAEGARETGKGLIVRRRYEDSPDPIRLGGIGGKVADSIEQRMKISSRIVVLGHLQRGGTPTAFDRILASKFGVSAVRCVHDGRFGQMVALRGSEVRAVPIEKAVGRLKRVPKNHALVQTARSLGCAFGDG